MAKNYRQSNYALNKYSTGIVYKYVDESVTEIRFEDISATDPTFTEEAFDELKEISNELYHKEAASDELYYKYIKATLDGEDAGNWVSTKTLEEEFFDSGKFTKEFDMILQHTQKIIDNADVIENNTEQLTMLDRYISECQREKQRLYERLVSEEISIDEFKTLKEKCNAEIQSYEQQKLISIKSAEKSKSEYTSKTRLLKMLKDVQKETTLTQALSDALVEKVFVYPDKSIKVKWKVKEFEAQMPS